jgi:arylsulfatase A-like enzyme
MKQWHGNASLITRLGKVPLIWSLALGAGGALATGCSSEPIADRAGVEQVGALGINLEAAPGVTLGSVAYSITGNGFSKSGSIDTSGSPTISGTIGGIPEGNGYTITLTATSVEGNQSFVGSASFNVTARRTTSVTIHLQGSGASRNGNVAVTGTLNAGPVVDQLSVSPLTVFVGKSVTLVGSGTDPDNGPLPLSYYWSSTGGSIDDPIAPHATLTSASPGTFAVKLTVSDGESTDSATTTVTFVKPDAGGSGGGGAPSKPNVLLIIADDLGSEATSLYPDLAGDAGQVPIPNIESLAQNGLVFDNAWASPVCSPTRGTIVSGLYGYRTGVTTVGNVLPTDTVSLFDRITAESPDYAQALFGKYHLGGGSIDPRPGGAFPDAPKILQHARDIGITNYRGILGGGLTDYYNWTAFDLNGPAVATTTYATTALTNFAIDFIHQQKATRPDKPWFLYQSFNAPHAANGGNSPYQVPPAELHHVDLSKVGSPKPGDYATNIPVYQADIQALDTELGRLLKEVDFTNTVVIFVGDNGVPPPVKDATGGLRNSKGSAYEGGVRVPLVITGAGVTRRGREDELFVTADLYATILSLTGIPVSQVNNSYSLKSLLSDEAASSGRTHSFTETSTGTSSRHYALKDRRYKLVYELGSRELYDLVADPKETTNLYTSPAHAAALSTLQAEIATLKAQGAAGYFP